LPVLFGAMVQEHHEINLLNEFAEPAAGAKGEAVADILQGRALAFQSLGKLPEAVAATDRALTMRRDADNLLFRAELANDQNNSALADKMVDEAYKLAPDSVSVLMAKVHQYERTGNDAGVLSLSDQVLKIVPAFNNARVAKIKLFLKRNEDAKAKTEVNYFLRRSAKSPFGLYYNAVLLSRAKDKKGAAQAIQSLPPEFVRVFPDEGMQMAQILFDNGNIETGAAILASALAAKPDLLDVRLRLAELRLSQNSPQSALGLLTPVKDSKEPRVQKLLGTIQTKIAKDRSF
jgi:tetratricopeptide (TPR) repeat protein